MFLRMRERVEAVRVVDGAIKTVLTIMACSLYKNSADLQGGPQRVQAENQEGFHDPLVRSGNQELCFS